jgi:hypothetical protein
MRCESRQSMAIATIKMQEQGDFVQFNNDIRSAIDEVETPLRSCGWT